MKNNKTVLITGATSGIGFELAKLFSSDHYDLVIVSRDEAKLNEVAEVFKKAGAGSVFVLPKDLSVSHAASEVYATTQKEGIHIDVLINDAGVGEYGTFAETNLENELDIIQLNISSLVHLTKLYLRDMLTTGKGGKIMQLASVASYQPTPMLAVYAATKAFVLSFSDAIGTELRDTNVTVTALIPNATATDFFNKAGMEHTKAAQNDPEDPMVVAKIGYDALLNGEPHAFAPGVKQMVVMSSLMPNRNVAKMAEKQMLPDDSKKEVIL